MFSQSRTTNKNHSSVSGHIVPKMCFWFVHRKIQKCGFFSLCSPPSTRSAEPSHLNLNIFRHMNEHKAISRRTFRKLHYSAKYCCRIVFDSTFQAETNFLFYSKPKFTMDRMLRQTQQKKKFLALCWSNEKKTSIQYKWVCLSFCFAHWIYPRIHRKSFGHQMVLQLQPWN